MNRMEPVDLRSDTVTRPTAGMRRAMAEAEVGDDVFGDDPTVDRLEAVLAERAGQEAAVFVPSGTQGNLVALMAHCQRGDEFICGTEAHTYSHEGGGAAVLGSIAPQPLVNRSDGSLDLAEVRSAVRPDDAHFPVTRLLCLEDTIGGRVLDRGYITDALALCREIGLAAHLDGARVFNAVVADGVELADITGGFDSVSICLSKGLGAPVGTVVCGERELIRRARRWRKVAGGGMRQAGVLAAAGLYALDHHVDRLVEDHARARRLAQGLADMDGIEVQRVDTNMVFLRVDAALTDALDAAFERRAVRALVGPEMRLVTHLDVDEAGLERTLEAFAEASRAAA